MMQRRRNDLPDQITIGDKYGPAMAITDEAEAKEYFRRCVRHTMRLNGEDREEAERVERMNIGYFAGYYDHETRARVERLFGCAHPIFGSIAEKGPPTADEAFAAGLALGKKGGSR